MNKELIGIATLAALSLGSTAVVFADSNTSGHGADVSAHQHVTTNQIFSLSVLGNPHPSYSSEQVSKARSVGTLKNPQTVLNLMVPLSVLGNPEPASSSAKAPANFTSNVSTTGSAGPFTTQAVPSKEALLLTDVPANHDQISVDGNFESGAYVLAINENNGKEYTSQLASGEMSGGKIHLTTTQGTYAVLIVNPTKSTQTYESITVYSK